MAKKKNSKENLVEEALENVRRDRSQAQLLLTKLLEGILKGEQTHRDVGFVVSKYLEVLQKSNEQIVKIIQMTKGNETNELSEEEREEVFDTLLEEEEE